MAIQPTRPEAYDTGTLNQYAHIYDVQAEEKRARIAEETEEAARIAADDAEKQARIEADDAEKQARIEADDAEKQARIAADDALGKRIDASAVEQMTPIKLTDDDKTASRQPVASGTRSLAFGPGAKATANQSVALGAFSQTSSRGNTVSVGSENLQRRIEYVDDPQAGTDAVNLRYFNENISNIGVLDLYQVKTDTNGKLTVDSVKYLNSLKSMVYIVTGEFEWQIARIGSTAQTIDVYVKSGSIANCFNTILIADDITGESRIVSSFIMPCYTRENTFMEMAITVNLTQRMPAGYVSVLTNPVDSTLIQSGLKLGVNIDTTRGGIESGDNGLYSTVAAQDTKGIVQGSDSITIADGVAKVNPSIFGDGLATTDGKVSVDTGFVGEHLAGDALYYDTTNGLMVKAGTGLHIDNDTLSVDQDTLPLASAGNRGTVKVGSGLAIAEDGTLSCNASGSGVTFNARCFTPPTGIESANLVCHSIDTDYTHIDYCYCKIVPSATFTVGTSFQFTIDSLNSDNTYAINSYFIRNADSYYRVTTNGSSIGERHSSGFTVDVTEGLGDVTFKVTMTDATLATGQALYIGIPY